MATRLYLRSSTASGVVPNAKQSGDTIYVDVASSYATYAAPADMLTTAGSGGVANSASGGTQKTLHYTHYGSWVSPAFEVARTISGTITVALSMTETNDQQTNYPRIYIYKWLANDTKGSDLRALTDSGTEIGTSYSLVTYFSGTSITETSFAVGDRIVIEIESSDTATNTTARVHGIQFDGADAGAYGSYLEFSQTFSFTAQTSYQEISISETPGVSLSSVCAQIQRNIDGGSYSNLIKTNWDAKAYTDSTVTPGHTYCYQVWRILDGVADRYSNTDCKQYPSGAQYYEDVFITETPTPSLTKQSLFPRILSIAETSTLTLTRLLEGQLNLLITETPSPTLSKAGSWFRSILISETSTITLEKLRTISISIAETPSLLLTRLPQKTLSISETPGLSLLAQVVKFVQLLISTTPTPAADNLTAELQRNDNGGAFAKVKLILWNMTQPYPDTGPFTGGHTYCYRIRKIVNGVAGFWSSIDCQLYTAGQEYFQTLEISESPSVLLTVIKSLNKLLEIAESATASLTRAFLKLRLLEIVESASAELSKIKHVSTSMIIDQYPSFSLSRILSLNRELSIAESAGTTLERLQGKLLAITESATASLSQAFVKLRELSISESASVSLDRVLTFFRELSFPETPTPLYIEKTLNAFKEFSISETSSLFLSAFLTFMQTLEITITPGIEFATKLTKSIMLVIEETATLALERAYTIVRVLEIAETSGITLVRQTYRDLFISETSGLSLLASKLYARALSIDSSIGLSLTLSKGLSKVIEITLTPLLSLTKGLYRTLSHIVSLTFTLFTSTTDVCAGEATITQAAGQPVIWDGTGDPIVRNRAGTPSIRCGRF